MEDSSHLSSSYPSVTSETTTETGSSPVSSDADSAPPALTGEGGELRFGQLRVRAEVLRAVTEMGFTEPMEVQNACFEPTLAGRDLIVQSRTGSGKTAAFGMPLSHSLPIGGGQVLALCLCPTRELALQVTDELSRVMKYTGHRVVPIYGGAPMGRQIEQLQSSTGAPEIVVGTPGRVLDHLRRGTLEVGALRCLILDECDEMLSMGFQKELDAIISRLPTERQGLLFSATVPDEIKRLSAKYLKTPEFVALSSGHIGASEIQHAFYMVTGLSRTRDLKRVLDYENPESAIIFCNTREDTGLVAAFLAKQGLDAEAISSDLTQADRERVMGRMRARNLKYLVATDIAARGIDISDLSHVINYTFPESPEVYVHRTGRTGRAGKQGVALSLISPREIGSFYYLKLIYKIRPHERTLPSDSELSTRREAEKLERLASAFSEDPGDEYRSLTRRLLSSDDGQRLVAVLLRRYFEAGTPVVERAGGERGDRGDRGASSDRAVSSERPDRAGSAGAERDRGGERERTPERAGERASGERSARGDRDRDRGGRGRGERDRDRGGRAGRTEREPRPERTEAAAAPASPTPVLAAEGTPVEAASTPVAAAAAEPRVAAAAEPQAAAEPRTAAPAREAHPAEAGAEGASADGRRRRRRRGRGDDKSAGAETETEEGGTEPAAEATPGPSRLATDFVFSEGRDFWESWADRKAPGQPAAEGSAAPAATRAAAAPTAARGEAAPTVDSDDEQATGDPEAEARGEMTRLYVNVGRRDGMRASDLARLLREAGIERGDVGRIQVRDRFAYVGVREALVDQALGGLNGKPIGDKTVVAERARRT